MAIQSNTIRRFLYGFIATLSVCALIGIYVIATGRMGIVEGKILGSTFLVAGTFLLGLFASVPTVRRRWHPIGPATILFIPVPLIMSLILIWQDGRFSYGTQDWEFWREYERWLGLAWDLGITLSVLCLLSLARLKSSVGWVFATTVIFGLVLSFVVAMILLFNISEDTGGRFVAILGILTTLGCISVPILHRVSAIPLADRVHTAKMEISLTCPRCAKAQVLLAGGANCVECKLRINIDIEEEQCRKCGYPLYKIDSAQCPECGTPIARPTAPLVPPVPMQPSQRTT